VYSIWQYRLDSDDFQVALSIFRIKSPPLDILRVKVQMKYSEQKGCAGIQATGEANKHEADLGREVLFSTLQIGKSVRECTK
jgi:hypothetical protein